MERRRFIPLALLGLLVLLPSPAPAAPLPVVGVIDFYSPSPLPWPTFDVVPERFAADDLAASLVQAGRGRYDVLPRSVVQQAEQQTRWQNDDVLRYSRMKDLAGRVHADRLVVGWIRELTVMQGGDDFFSPVVARATVVVQVFDAAQGRLVFDTTGSIVVVGGTASELLHGALQPTIAPVSAALSETAAQ